MSEMQHRAMKPTSVARLIERWKAAIAARKSAFPSGEWDYEDPAHTAMTDAVHHVLDRLFATPAAHLGDVARKLGVFEQDLIIGDCPESAVWVRGIIRDVERMIGPFGAEAAEEPPASAEADVSSPSFAEALRALELARAAAAAFKSDMLSDYVDRVFSEFVAIESNCWRAAAFAPAASFVDVRRKLQMLQARAQQDDDSCAADALQALLADVERLAPGPTDQAAAAAR